MFCTAKAWFHLHVYLVLIAYVSILWVEQIHTLLVVHRQCPEHGEVIHSAVATEHTRSSATELGFTNYQQQATSFHTSTHDHCLVHWLRIASYFENTSVHSFRLFSADGVPRHEQIDACESVLFRAPKQSPPSILVS